MLRFPLVIGSIVSSLILGWATSPASSAADTSYSPYAGEDFPRNVYFGDTHIHSSWSADAGNMGNRRIGPDDAYRFARGDEITAHNGMSVRLRRPLDFILLSDHAEYLGVMNMLDQEDPVLLATEVGARWAEWRRTGRDIEVFTEFGMSLLESSDIIDSVDVERTVWSRVVANADRWNEPGVFTAFIGYEWTSTPNGKNLHRNVIFADGAELAGPGRPLELLRRSAARVRCGASWRATRRRPADASSRSRTTRT